MAEKKSKKKWIAKATEDSHGQFKAKAEAAGKSTKSFAEEKKSAPGVLGKQARLALALMGASHKNENKHRSGKDIRKSMYGKED